MKMHRLYLWFCSFYIKNHVDDYIGNYDQNIITRSINVMRKNPINTLHTNPLGKYIQNGKSL
jgi:hypothetical protein